MKLICSALLFIALFALESVHCDEGFSYEDVFSYLESMAEECDPKPEKEHIEELINNEENAQRGTKCFRYCIMKNFELIDKDSTQMNEDKMTDGMAMMYSDKDEELKEFIKKCNKQNAAIQDGCDAAHAHFVCIFKEMKAKNYNIPETKKNSKK